MKVTANHIAHVLLLVNAYTKITASDYKKKKKITYFSLTHAQHA